MIFQCPICNSMQESESSFQITFFKDEDSIIHRNECIVYQQFLTLISKKTSLNKNVVDVLYLTEGINKILNIKDNYQILSDYSTKDIPENIAFNKNYEKEIHYIFAKFLEINPNFNITIRCNSFSSAVYLVNKDILINLTRTYKPTILFFVELNVNDIIPYDINLLNDIEKSKLQKNILPCLYKCEDLNENRYFKKKLDIENKDDLSIIYQKIAIQIDNFKKEIQEENIKLKEDNKKYFERALVELELKEF